MIVISIQTSMAKYCKNKIIKKGSLTETRKSY